MHKSQDISHWFAQIHGDATPIPTRERLDGSINADVAIVGAGYTGLWTAYELLRARPELRVVVLEAKFAGYGPSGRNGGAAIAQLNGSREFWAKKGGGREAAVRMERAVQQGVDHIGDAVQREGFDCSYAKNGVLMVARSALEMRGWQESIAADRAWGFEEEDTRLIGRDELQSRVSIKNGLGAKFNAHCASIDPARLVVGLAAAVERLGGTIYEDTRVNRIEQGRAVTGNGTVNAQYVVRATEAYSGWLEGHKRSIVPVHTTMIATEPIPDELWKLIGWDRREAVLAEHPFLHLQHTSDHRITIGGDDPRVPYLSGSKTSTDDHPEQRLQDHLRGQLVKLFPELAEVGIDHAWSGVFGAPRDWAPSVGLDRQTGLAWAGGYVGEGVVASNMAGRTLRDLILNDDTEMTRLPWVRKPGRKWEPEPIRTVGAQVIFRGRLWGERAEERSGRPSKLLALSNRVAGFTGHLG
ncbi:FAD-dependent oxidoreductase [Leifsonia kafniensis]|uniref:FAD-dependent oxidoreductase n=1 Tax=Leifsonia kafniensis TaxID=475957 RepID=A0ABP7KN50_9MICO